MVVGPTGASGAPAARPVPWEPEREAERATTQARRMEASPALDPIPELKNALTALVWNQCQVCTLVGNNLKEVSFEQARNGLLGHLGQFAMEVARTILESAGDTGIARALILKAKYQIVTEQALSKRSAHSAPEVKLFMLNRVKN